MAAGDPSHAVSFYVNGRRVTIENPAPDLLLIDYLRSPEVALAGPKKPCGQGGCGGCTVILSRWNEAKKAPEHRAINSCLRPVCALGGLVVTTVEGTGAARRPEPGDPAASADRLARRRTDRRARHRRRSSPPPRRRARSATRCSRRCRRPARPTARRRWSSWWPPRPRHRPSTRTTA